MERTKTKAFSFVGLSKELLIQICSTKSRHLLIYFCFNFKFLLKISHEEWVVDRGHRIISVPNLTSFVIIKASSDEWIGNFSFLLQSEGVCIYSTIRALPNALNSFLLFNNGIMEFLPTSLKMPARLR